MRTQTPLPTLCASLSRHCANASASPRSSAPLPALDIASRLQQTAGLRAETVDRAPGLSVRLKLTLSYAGFLMLASGLLLATVWVFLLRYVPDRPIVTRGFVPSQSDLLDAFAPRAAGALAFLLVFGLVGGWMP